MQMLGDLSAQYESNGDAGCISSGYGDPGGKSYGAYQFSSNAGTLGDFVQWYTYKYPGQTDNLINLPLCSWEFDQEWKSVAAYHYYDFYSAQHEYIKEKFYKPACTYLANAGFHVENHHPVMEDVIWSRAVQYGPGLIVEMFEDAVHQMYNAQEGGYSGYYNLSYVDSPEYDYDFISSVYLRVCSSWEWNNSGLRESLNQRFASECQDALSRLTNR